MSTKSGWRTSRPPSDRRPPTDKARRQGKIEGLAGDRIYGMLDDLEAPVARVVVQPPSAEPHGNKSPA